MSAGLSLLQLLHPRAAALNQDYEHDDEQNAGNYTNKRIGIHSNSPWLMFRLKKGARRLNLRRVYPGERGGRYFTRVRRR